MKTRKRDDKISEGSEVTNEFCMSDNTLHRHALAYVKLPDRLKILILKRYCAIAYDIDESIKKLV